MPQNRIPCEWLAQVKGSLLFPGVYVGSKLDWAKNSDATVASFS